MSKVETILTRMMNETEFSNAVSLDAERALAEYELSADEIAGFNGLSHAAFEEMMIDGRKSFVTLVQSFNVFNRLVA